MIDSAKGTEKKVSSKWFAYRAMMFLGDHYKPRGTRNISEVKRTYIYKFISLNNFLII